MKELWPKIKPYIPEKGQRAIEDDGVSEVDEDGDLVTTLVEGRGECAFTVFDEKGIALCGVEKAWKDGAIPFRKPISCHLYPIRVVKLKFTMDSTTTSGRSASRPASAARSWMCRCYRFLKDALVRAYGEEWYAELEEIYRRGRRRRAKHIR